VGAGYNDAYERSLRLEISKENIKDRVLFHGISNCVDELLAESKIGVLSSTSEGLPMALLEYGKARLAVVSTNVGYCGEVISTFGQVVGVDDVSKLSEALRVYMDNNIRREFDAIAFQNHIYSCYSENTVIPLIEKIYKNALRIL
jgi:glycosyltransferase involved in cell wall biosynthesis